MIDHELKIKIEFMDQILNGNKKFEIRNNDRGFEVGHVVQLHEIDDNGEYTGTSLIVDITYITNYEQKDGYIVFGFQG